MPATPAWLATAEAVLNRSIDASGQAAALARRLEGTALEIDVQGLVRIRSSVFRGRLSLFTGNGTAAAEPGASGAAPNAADLATAADATIAGSLPALLQLLGGGTQHEAGSAGKPRVEVRGDAEIANLYRELIILARPDPEEELSRWIGDFPARRLSEFAERVRGFVRHARRTAGENIAEYLQEEGRDLVNKTELDEFLHGVDQVRETADRIDARLARLERRMKDLP